MNTKTYYFIFGGVAIVFILLYLISFINHKQHASEADAIGMDSSTNSVDESSLGTLQDIIHAKYISLFLKAVVLTILTGFAIYATYYSSNDLFEIRKATGFAKYLPLIAIGIIGGYAVYFLFLMTKKIFIYQNGIEIKSLFKQENYHYDEITSMTWRIHRQYQRPGQFDFLVYIFAKYPAYTILFKGKVPQILRGNQYSKLVKKLDHVRYDLLHLETPNPVDNLIERY